MNRASKFVDLVLSKQWKPASDVFSVDEVQIFFDTVSAAGFNPKEIVRGMLVGHYRDQDGSVTGETYPINYVCPYKVVNEDGADNYFATGWLDCAFRRVVYGATQNDESREKLTEVINEEIKLSRLPLIWF